MSGKTTKITIDGEWLLAKFQEIEYIIDEIRAKCGDGSFVEGTRPARRTPKGRTQDGTPVSPQPPSGIFDIDLIDWKIKNSEAARVDDPWAWAFGYDQDGAVLPETQALITELLHEDMVVVGIYEITLSGTDKKLLSRKIPKSRRRKKQ